MSSDIPRLTGDELIEKIKNSDAWSVTFCMDKEVTFTINNDTTYHGPDPIETGLPGYLNFLSIFEKVTGFNVLTKAFGR